MADFNNNNGGRYKRFQSDHAYVVDSGRVFNEPLYSGINKGRQKPKREMIVKMLIAFWYGVGLPCWIISTLTYLFGWIHNLDIQFITATIGGLLALSKVIILWAEKGDKVQAKINKFLKNRRREKEMRRIKKNRNRFQ